MQNYRDDKLHIYFVQPNVCMQATRPGHGEGESSQGNTVLHAESSLPQNVVICTISNFTP